MKLTLRDLFWLILVMAIVTEWWVQRGDVVRLEKENRDLRFGNEALKGVAEDHGYRVWLHDDGEVHWVAPRDNRIPQRY